MDLRTGSPGTAYAQRLPHPGKSGRAGFTLLEMLVALVVLSIGVLGYMTLQFRSLSGRTFARSMNGAGTVGITQLEEMRTIDFDQLGGSGTVYRFKCDGAEASEADFEDGRAYKIEGDTGDFTGISSNPNVRLLELKAIHAVVRWKERGVEYSIPLATFQRGL
jgi:prepilin-type N-terminal cleavage/methylation domain-containing protein